MPISVGPQAVTDLVINAATEMSETTVMFSTDWVRPSGRNGSFGYLLQFEADQLEPYPQTRQSSVNLMNLALDDGDLETFTFEGALPFANYTITLTAVNAKLNKPGPSVTVEGRTTAIGKCFSALCVSFLAELKFDNTLLLQLQLPSLS